MAGYDLPSASNLEVAEIISWAIENAGVEEVQLTGGTLFGSQTECRRYAGLLQTIEKVVGLDRLRGEIYCYLTAPDDPSEVDQIFAAGACSPGRNTWPVGESFRPSPFGCRPRVQSGPIQSHPAGIIIVRLAKSLLAFTELTGLTRPVLPPAPMFLFAVISTVISI